MGENDPLFEWEDMIAEGDSEWWIDSNDRWGIDKDGVDGFIGASILRDLYFER